MIAAGKDERLDEWRSVLEETEGLPPVLRVVILLDAWNVLQGDLNLCRSMDMFFVVVRNEGSYVG